MKPRVIWLDDEIHKENLKATVIRFKKKFDVVLCETLDEFREKSKTSLWDAAILDVLNKDGKSGDAHSAVSFVMREFPDRKWFLFSGQDRITKDDNDFKDTYSNLEFARNYVKKTVYVKSEDEDNLISDIVDAVENSRQWIIEKEYEQVLNIVSEKLCKDVRLDKERKDLLNILCAAGGAATIDSRLYYNRIRVILEKMFRAAKYYGLLHEKCFDSNDHINLTDASMYMAGLPTAHSGVICSKTHFPSLIAKNVKYIIEVTGGASHTTEVDKKENPDIESYWNTINTPYLLYGLAYMLCDVLVWFDKYVELHQDVEANKSMGRDLVLDGELKQDENNNYYVGDCLIPWSTVKNLNVGTRYIVDEHIPTDSRKKVRYVSMAVKLHKSSEK